MCVDFTDLNKACPKDSFPLPKIDQLVDSTAGHGLLSFMDAFSGYNQIPMDEQDEESTAFITNMGLFCYRVMPFGLKNAGATYQRLVNKIFKPLIGHTMEVYVDDMITKSKEPRDHVKHLEETFELLRKYEMKLNSEKCAFGVSSGKFLGFLVSHRGIEANPEKIRSVTEMRSPRTVKEVQSLTGKLAALNRFISRATDKCHPFFQIIKKLRKMEWTSECEEAFGQLKEYLARAPLLSTPREGDQLFLYLAISEWATSSVLVREEEGKQHPVYYTSKALVDAETRYPLMERWALTLITAARKLRPYFQAHQIVVITDQPLWQTLQKPDASGRLVKWSVELSEFDLSYKPRGAIKAQALAEFMVDRAEPGEEVREEQPIEQEKTEGVWLIMVDGSCSEQGSGAGVVIRSPEGTEITYAVKFEFQLTNNQAEYEAFITGLGLAHALRAERIEIRADSQLVCNQLNDQFQARGEKMGLYLKKARQMVGLFQEVEVKQISQNENYRADMLARMAAIADPKLPKSVPLEVRTSPSIGEEVEVMRVSTGESWMDPIRAYIRDGVLPEDKRQARKLKCRAARYTLLDEVLYRRGFTLPLLRCVDEEEADYVLREIHEGICGNHSGARTLAFKALRQGYFWPTMHQDAKRMTKNCKTYQSFSEVPAQPPEKLTTMTSLWPFTQWGIDLIGPLPKGRRAATHAIVAIDYFTKWVEVGALSQITERKTTDFIWKNIIYRYGIPYTIITNNGKQFDNGNFREFCQNLGVDLKLGEKKGAWVDELPRVLWAYRTTHKTATGETPFALAFGHEAVVPAEIGVGTHRTEYFTEKQNDEQICLSLDLLEEKREGASQKVTQCQQRVMRYYNKNVRVRQFQTEDWVLRKVNQNTRNPNHGALRPKWEGPYRVIRATGPGAYKLAYPDGREVKRSWNAEHLKKYFQ
ncbi:uncharacterized protein LOC127899240 [Citrus sinensis]|uniref:protein NYNRIN-like n=1 Tax=Citrus clementina TaxID=85681 RepID=UPI000CED3638|nr:protein NYNRIN-like [Citrus x clementina]XP_052288537.1 uncharacterized protein LOC127899240 [Citrus sinensis]